jgi:hypothetical protein
MTIDPDYMGAAAGLDPLIRAFSFQVMGLTSYFCSTLQLVRLALWYRVTSRTDLRRRLNNLSLVGAQCRLVPISIRACRAVDFNHPLPP